MTTKKMTLTLPREYRDPGGGIVWYMTLARYAKGSVAVSCYSANGIKTGAAIICEKLRGRWSGRERAYIMSEAKGRKFIALWNEAVDALPPKCLRYAGMMGHEFAVVEPDTQEGSGQAWRVVAECTALEWAVVHLADKPQRRIYRKCEGAWIRDR